MTATQKKTNMSGVMPGSKKMFTCPNNGSTYSCSLGTRGCMAPFNPACCGLKGDNKDCPYQVTPHSIVGRKKTFTCPNGASYECSPGSEQGCVEPINEACCLLGAGTCPFQVKRPLVPPMPPSPPHPRTEIDFEVCACATIDTCPAIVRACTASPEHPLCEKVLPFCNWFNQESDNRAEGYVSNAYMRPGM